MHRPILFSFLIFLCLSVPAAGVTLYPLPGGPVERAAARYKLKDFSGARQAALEAPAGPTRDFIAGMASVKLSRWEEAAPLLDRAATGFPLLGDYALFHKAKSLFNLSRFREASGTLEIMLKQYPESPLNREALLLLGDSLFSDKSPSAALETYQKFIDRYPSGSDSLAALHSSALCREQLGDLKGAAGILRTIWLTYPASPVAEKANADLKRLADRGVDVGSYTPEETFKRGVILYDLRKYEQSLATFNSLSKESESAELKARISLRTAQALFKLRRYRDAEDILTKLDLSSLKKGVCEEALYCLARSLDRNNKENESVAVFLRLTDTYPDSELADNALLEAALVRKSQKQGAAAAELLSRLLTAYPQSNLRQSALWELAWDSYQGRRYAEAADRFAQLFDAEPYRERAMYWNARSVAATGNDAAARTAFANLLSEFPFGFYAAYYRSTNQAQDLPPVAPVGPKTHTAGFAGFERERALIAFGMYDEARRELGSAKKKPVSKNGGTQAIAELYLEMGDYNGAFNAYTKDSSARKDAAPNWGFTYPLAFSDLVTTHAEKNRLPADLVYSIIRAESSYSPVAKSPVGAIGLMQLMPTTASSLTKNGTITNDKLTEPALNISLGTKHLRHLLDLYRNETAFAVAAYNAGAGNVNRWKKSMGTLPLDEFIESIPYGETREYVKKVLAASAMYKRLYSLDLKTVQSPQPPAEGQAVEPDAQQPELKKISSSESTSVSPASGN